MLELAGQSAGGQGVSTDIIEAAALAYVRALSNAERRVAGRRRGRRGRGRRPRAHPDARRSDGHLGSAHGAASRGRASAYQDEEFVIERTIRFEEDDCVWFEHRLSSDGTGRSLWLEIPADPDDGVIVYDSSETLELRPDGGPEIEHGGRAAAAADERPGELPQRGALGRAEDGASSSTTNTRSGDRRVTYECRSHDSVWEVSEGRAIDGAAIEMQA